MIDAPLCQRRGGKGFGGGGGQQGGSMGWKGGHEERDGGVVKSTFGVGGIELIGGDMDEG